MNIYERKQIEKKIDTVFAETSNPSRVVAAVAAFRRKVLVTFQRVVAPSAR